MTIKAHCMGMEFPATKVLIKRGPLCFGEERFWGFVLREHLYWGYETLSDACAVALNLLALGGASNLPTAADLDAVAEEQRVKEKTGG